MTAVDTLERFDATIERLGVVLSPNDAPEEVEGVLNPAGAVARDGTLLLYPRAVAAGNVSRVELCRGIRTAAISASSGRASRSSPARRMRYGPCPAGWAAKTRA